MGCQAIKNVPDLNLENEANSFFNGFTIDHGYSSDPIWGTDNFRVLEHNQDNLFLYLRDEDNAIQFIYHDKSSGTFTDDAYYFPSGLVQDNYAFTTSDFDFKYA